MNRRIRIRGVVTSYIPGHPVEISDFTTTATFRYVRNVLYVDDGTGGARIETEQPQRVEPGTIVDVAGFPAVTPGKPILTNAVFKVAGMATQPAAAAVSDANVLSADNDATLVRMQAHFLSVLRTPIGADAGAADRGERLPGDARGGARRGVPRTASRRDDRRSHRRLRLSVGTFAVVPALPAVQPATSRCSRRRHGGRSGTPAVMIAILALGACAAAFWVRRGREAPPAAVSGGADRAQPGGARAPRHARAGARGDLAAAGGGRRQPRGVARTRTAVAGSGAADAAVQPGGSAAVGHGSSRAGARKPRPRWCAHRPGRADGTIGRRRRTGDRGGIAAPPRRVRTSTTCCASASRRSPTR